MGLLIFGIVLLGLKDVAYLWSLARLPFMGKAMQEAYGDNATRAPHEHLPGELNAIDRVIGGLAVRPKRLIDAHDWKAHALTYRLLVKAWWVAALAARVCFTAPGAIVLGTVIEFLLLSRACYTLGVILGVLLALCSIFVVLAAVLRRLVIGRNDWMTSDVGIPNVGPLRDWAARNEPGANLSVYFLVVVMLSVLGFASLYYAMHVARATSFAPTNTPSRITWFYFSATTLGTIGLGDVHPVTGLAQLAVLCQAATGPLLLSWLLAAFFAR